MDSDGRVHDLGSWNQGWLCSRLHKSLKIEAISCMSIILPRRKDCCVQNLEYDSTDPGWIFGMRICKYVIGNIQPGLSYRTPWGLWFFLPAGRPKAIGSLNPETLLPLKTSALSHKWYQIQPLRILLQRPVGHFCPELCHNALKEMWVLTSFHTFQRNHFVCSWHLWWAASFMFWRN